MIADSQPIGGIGPTQFPATHWSLIRKAREPGAADSIPAWDRMIREYWRAVYAYVRRRWNKSADDAADLTQGFFTRLFEHRDLGAADQSSFRAFLRIALQHFLVDEHRRTDASKRGGGARLESLDAIRADRGDLPIPSEDQTPDEVFDSAWNRAVLHGALHDLRADPPATGGPTLFDVLRLYYFEPGEDRTYEGVAAQLGVSAREVRHALVRARAELRERIRTRVEQYVEGPVEVEAEIRLILGS